MSEFLACLVTALLFLSLLALVGAGLVHMLNRDRIYPEDREALNDQINDKLKEMDKLK